MNSTSNTDINIGTRVLFVPELPEPQRPPQPVVVRDGPRLDADPNQLSPADIERMTREVVDEILRGLSDPELDGFR